MEAVRQVRSGQAIAVVAKVLGIPSRCAVARGARQQEVVAKVLGIPSRC